MMKHALFGLAAMLVLVITACGGAEKERCAQDAEDMSDRLGGIVNEAIFLSQASRATNLELWPDLNQRTKAAIEDGRELIARCRRWTPKDIIDSLNDGLDEMEAARRQINRELY